MIRVFKIFVPASVLVLLVSDVFIVYASFLAVAYWWSGPDLGDFLWVNNGFGRISVVVGLYMLCLYFQDFAQDELRRIKSRLRTVQKLCLAVGVVYIAEALITYINPDWGLPQWLLMGGSLLAASALLLWELFFGAVVGLVGPQRILFAGSSPPIFEVADYLLGHPEYGYLPVGYLADKDHQRIQRFPRLGTTQDLDQVIVDCAPHRIAVEICANRPSVPIQDFIELRYTGIQTEEMANLYEATFGRVCSREIRPTQVVFSKDLQPKWYNFHGQRIFSFGVATMMLLLLSPLIVIVVLLLKLASKEPVLIREPRVGLNGKPFNLLRFRCAGAPDRWLQRGRLDRLPQLLNLLAGEMSLVGPRPHRLEFAAVMGARLPLYQWRHGVMPGLTGWAQVNRLSDSLAEDAVKKLEYDLYYIRHASFSMDFYVLLRAARNWLVHLMA